MVGSEAAKPRSREAAKPRSREAMVPGTPSSHLFGHNIPQYASQPPDRPVRYVSYSRTLHPASFMASFRSSSSPALYAVRIFERDELCTCLVKEYSTSSIRHAAYCSTTRGGRMSMLVMRHSHEDSDAVRVWELAGRESGEAARLYGVEMRGAGTAISVDLWIHRSQRKKSILRS
jgi:hypothetical protein